MTILRLPKKKGKANAGELKKERKKDSSKRLVNFIN